MAGGRLAAAAALVVAAGLVAGCGGDEDPEPLSGSDYVQRINQAQQGFVTEVGKLTAVAARPAEIPSRLNGVADAIEALVRKLEDIEPPDEVERSQARLERALDGYADSLRELAPPLASTDGARRQRGLRRLRDATQRAATDLDRTIKSMNSALEQ